MFRVFKSKETSTVGLQASRLLSTVFRELHLSNNHLASNKIPDNTEK